MFQGCSCQPGIAFMFLEITFTVPLRPLYLTTLILLKPFYSCQENLPVLTASV